MHPKPCNAPYQVDLVPLRPQTPATVPYGAFFCAWGSPYGVIRCPLWAYGAVGDDPGVFWGWVWGLVHRVRALHRAYVGVEGAVNASNLLIQGSRGGRSSGNHPDPPQVRPYGGVESVAQA